MFEELTDNMILTQQNNKEKMKNKSLMSANVKIAIVVIIGLVIFSIFLRFDNLQQENELLKTIMIADNDWGGVSIIEQEAENYYDLALLDYEYENYKGAESNCKMAREYYSLTIQGYNDIKAELISKDIKHILIDIYIETLEETTTINYNMFESCEYLEGASRSYNAEDYISGDWEIDMMNEKIIIHDDAVKRYNELLSEFKAELKKLK